MQDLACTPEQQQVDVAWLRREPSCFHAVFDRPRLFFLFLLFDRSLLLLFFLFLLFDRSLSLSRPLDFSLSRRPPEPPPRWRSSSSFNICFLMSDRSMCCLRSARIMSRDVIRLLPRASKSRLSCVLDAAMRHSAVRATPSRKSALALDASRAAFAAAVVPNLTYERSCFLESRGGIQHAVTSPN